MDRTADNDISKEGDLDHHHRHSQQQQQQLDPEGKLLETVRHCLEGNAYLRRARCDMRKKVLETIQGSGESLFPTATGKDSSSSSPPQAIQLINQLVLEYLDWCNLQYSAEMFSVESGTARLEPSLRRQALRSSLKPSLDDPIEFQPDLPVLAELVMKLAAADDPAE